MYDCNQPQMFAGLPEQKNRWQSLVCGYASQFVITSLAIVIMIATPAVVQPKHFANISLIAPPEEKAPVVQSPPPQIRVQYIQPVRMPQPTNPDAIEAPVLIKQEMPKLQIATSAPKPVLIAETNQFNQVAPAARPQTNNVAQVQINQFGGSPVQTGGKLNPSKVQTGGFGDPNSTGTPVPGAKANVAALGSFDLAVGDGHGNGTGGRKGAVGAVATAGFAAPAIAGSQGRKGGNVQLSSFGEVTQAAPAARTQVARQESPLTPAEIRSKPSPVYTSEARKLGVEGDVVLQVVLAADGKVRVTRVVRGLGHGLDEAAMRAAEGLVFKPAQRDGRPVDSLATLHIVFQLS